MQILSRISSNFREDLGLISEKFVLRDALNAV